MAHVTLSNYRLPGLITSLRKWKSCEVSPRPSHQLTARDTISRCQCRLRPTLFTSAAKTPQKRLRSTQLISAAHPPSHRSNSDSDAKPLGASFDTRESRDNRGRNLRGSEMAEVTLNTLLSRLRQVNLPSLSSMLPSAAFNLLLLLSLAACCLDLVPPALAIRGLPGSQLLLAATDIPKEVRDDSSSSNKSRMQGVEDELSNGSEEFIRAGLRPDIQMERATLLGPPSTTPQQVHVSLASPGSMLVTWVTSDLSAPSLVDFGLLPGEYKWQAKGESETYSYFLYRSGLIHHVQLGSTASPLPPNTTFFYRCGGEGAEFSFKTPPSQGPDTPLNIAIVGDLGQTGWSVTTLNQIQGFDHDILLLAGDLSYADRYQPRWDSWGNLVQPLASSRPWMTVEGNHEIEGVFGLEPPFAAYNARWPMPHQASGSPSNLYYSFELGGAHFLMLGSYTDYSRSSEQFQWLKADLAAVDRSRTPWLIAVLHAPWYNSNSAHQHDGDGMMDAMEDLLYSAGVDMVFAGHVHAYERFARVYHGMADPCGIVHITIGDGGNREGLATRYLDPRPETSLVREASFGHGELRIMNASTALWTWHRNQDDDAVMADNMWIDSNVCARGHMNSMTHK